MSPRKLIVNLLGFGLEQLVDLVHPLYALLDASHDSALLRYRDIQNGHPFQILSP